MCTSAISTHVRDHDLDLAADRWLAVVIFRHLPGSDGTETEQSGASSLFGRPLPLRSAVSNQVPHRRGVVRAITLSGSRGGTWRRSNFRRYSNWHQAVKMIGAPGLHFPRPSPHRQPPGGWLRSEPAGPHAADGTRQRACRDDLPAHHPGSRLEHRRRDEQQDQRDWEKPPRLTTPRRPEHRSTPASGTRVAREPHR
jgi:hypothetical protein